MFKPHFIKTESGEELVVLSRQEFDDMRRRKETAENIEELIHDRMIEGDGWLFAARKARRWSQYRLARESGISQSYVSRLENEFRDQKPTREVVAKIAQALSVAPAYVWDF